MAYEPNQAIYQYYHLRERKRKAKGATGGHCELYYHQPAILNWALRDYGIEPMIWDGDINCEHRWEDTTYVRNTDLTAGTKQRTNIGSVGRDEPVQNAFCSLCGAWRGCLGLEPTIELYLKHLVGIFDEAKRVLRDDGVAFVNLGDTYNNATPGARDAERWPKQSRNDHTPDKRPPATVPIKSLCLIPFRFAIAMVERGWILRNTIIWSKPNPMPSSAKDRFTVDFEYVFFFSKSSKPTFWIHSRKLRMTGKKPKPDHIWIHKNTGLECDYQPFSDRICKGKKRFWNRRNLWEGEDYWFEPQYEEQCQSTIDHAPRKPRTLKGEDEKGLKPTFGSINELPLGRNKRTTWTIPTEAFPEAHFATFPQALVEPMIKCGCPEFVCPKCGKARVKVYETIGKKQVSWGVDRKARVFGTPGQPAMKNIDVEIGLTSCSCNAGYEPGIVLDFFCGSGTVGKVAAYLRRNYILIDAKEEYCQMAEERVKEPETGLTVSEQRQGQGSLWQ